jgi:hypothetical protein
MEKRMTKTHTQRPINFFFRFFHVYKNLSKYSCLIKIEVTTFRLKKSTPTVLYRYIQVWINLKQFSWDGSIKMKKTKEEKEEKKGRAYHYLCVSCTTFLQIKMSFTSFGPS